MRFIKNFFPILIIASLLSACAALPAQAPTPSATAPSLVKVTLPVGYVPNVQFAPLYVAMDKGYYRAQGIDLSLDYSTETDSLSLVGAGKLQFAIVSGEQVLLARAQGLPVVYVMAWYQQYPVGVASKVSENITKPQDLKGKRIGLPGLYGASYIGLRALLSAGGLTEKDVTLDSIGYNQVAALTAGQDQAVVIYVANEPIQLESEGVKLNVIKVSDYVDLAANGLITNEATLKNDPGLVRGMIKATLQGLQDTINDPTQAYQISEKYVQTLAQANQTIQKQILTSSIDEWKAQRLGYSQPDSWTNMQKVLLDMGLLTKPLDLSQAYSNAYLP
jgi:NitT/TauT family transport system substrate-binding protein